MNKFRSFIGALALASVSFSATASNGNEAAALKPNLYVCEDAVEKIYFVIFASNGSFIFFDDEGAYLQSGQLYQGVTEKNKMEFFGADLDNGKIRIRFHLSEGGVWNLVIGDENRNIIGHMLCR